MRVRRALSTIASAGALAGALVGATLATSPGAAGQADPLQLPTAAIALGDSFVSGEGAGAYQSVADLNGVSQGFPGWTAPNSNAYFCHRSANASIQVAELAGVSARFNLACSGGQPADMAAASSARPKGRTVASQITQLRQVAQTHDIDVVLIGLGSNNSQFTFGTVASECAGRFVAAGYTGWWEIWVPLMNWLSGTPVANENPCTLAEMATDAQVAAATQETTAAVRQVLTALAEVDADGQHTVVLQDYTSPLPTEFATQYHDEDGRTDTRDKFRELVRERYAAGCPAHRASLGPAAQFTDKLAGIVHSTYATLKAERPAEKLVFLDVRRAFDGARLCENPGSPAGTLATPLRLQDQPNGTFVQSLSGYDKIGVQRLSKTCNTYFQTCQESWHPNLAGHQALGACLSSAVTIGGGQVTCRRLPDGTMTTS
ncbi:hypothetical protein [Nocardioides sp.]|uniref:hypothetical protein n=1 Tax=Nocardioides sp. TaxID=35761 RepID=UPI002B6406A4|nr:hypothetical protein [Nocardioides sp.]HXH80392.1 hypothetical protein [Nocardioides sp.]